MSDHPPATHPRKLEIVEAAVTCFLENGYHQTGVRDIARQADISLGNLYNHFGGKEAVLAYIAEIEGEELSGFIDMLSEPVDPQATLERFVEDYAAYVSRPENALLGVEILTEALRNPTIGEIFGKNRNRLIDALVSCLNAGSRSGTFAEFEDARAVACMILDSLEAHGLRNLSEDKKDGKSIHTLQAFFLNGLRS